MLKAAIKLTFLLALGITGNSQKSDEPAHNLKPRNYLGFSLIPSFAEKAIIEGDKDPYNLHSHPKFGLESLIQYHFNFRKNYSLIIGAGGNVFTTCFHYYIPKEMFDPPTDSDITSKKYPNGVTFTGPTSVKIQAELLRRWRRNKVNSWNATAGLSLLYSFERGLLQTWDSVHYPGGQAKQFVIFTINYDNNYEKPWINYHISGGHEWILKSKDILQVNLKLNLSPTDPFKATYLFITGIQPDLSGTFKSSGSYIGLSIAYILTSVSFRIKEKNPK